MGDKLLVFVRPREVSQIIAKLQTNLRNTFLGPRGPLIEPSMLVPSVLSRAKNPYHLYSLINRRRITVNLSKEKKGKREKEKRSKGGEKEKKRKRKKGKKRKRE